jgi:esterase/lipase superfamily enzyme
MHGGSRRQTVAGGLCLLAAGFAMMLAAGCASIGLSAGDELAPEPRSLSIFVVSTRKGESGVSSDTAAENGARFSLQMMSVPPGHEPGKVERPAFGSEDPQKHFVMGSFRELDETAFYTELASHISGRIGSNRDVLLYVHGFNTSYDDARFRLAQISADARFGGVPALYTWPAHGSLLDYGAAKESATIARDALSRLLRRLSEVPDVGRVHILAHSMGAWLAMEALRENAISGSPDLNGKLGDVMLAAPDIDLNVFRQQLARLDPSHVFVLIAANDRALSLSRTLAGDRPRLGALDPNDPNDRAALEELGVKAYDLSAESTGFIRHATYANAPQVVRTIGAQLTERRPQDANVQAVLGEKPVDPKIIAVPLAPPSPTPSAAAVPPR